MRGVARAASRAALPLALLALTAAGKPALNPGKWTVTTTFLSLEMKGMPPGLGKAIAGKPIVWTGCVSAANAAKGPPMGAEAPGCSATSNMAANGRYTAHRVCRVSGSTTVTDVTGSYTATSFVATGRNVTTGGAASTATLKMTGKRLGGC
jgi:hypothetical protein